MFVKSLCVKNYRTLEDIAINFEPGYTAICGRNNSGKSNLLKALRLLLGVGSHIFPFGEMLEVSQKSDYCAWKKDPTNSGEIYFEATLRFSRIEDEGMLALIENIDQSFTKIPRGEEAIELIVSLNIGSDNEFSNRPKILINGNEISEISVSETIYEKLRSTVLFHNSTLSGGKIFFAPSESLRGVIKQVPQSTRETLNAKVSSLKKEIDKMFRNHESDMQNMLGRLGDKFEVKITTPDFDVQELPYGISLGFKGFEIPLDDWGSGTRNQTLILRRLFEAKSQKVSETISNRITPILIVEEPESFLHPQAQAQFGDVLQSLALEFGIQVIVTTHSPYLLSHKNPNANILIERNWEIKQNRLGASKIVEKSNENWVKPFELALGIPGREIAEFKGAIFSEQNTIILVEGEIDRAYLELCRQPIHGKKALIPEGEIYGYDGKSNLTNGTLLKFIRDRMKKVIVTCDLDAEAELKPKLEALGFVKDKDFFTIGINEPGKRNIEGLLPDWIKQKVLSSNVALTDASLSDKSNEARAAKNKLKREYLNVFSESASADNGDFDLFYKLCNKLNIAMKRDSGSKRGNQSFNIFCGTEIFGTISPNVKNPKVASVTTYLFVPLQLPLIGSLQ